MEIEILESNATNYHILRRGEVDEHETVVQGGLIEAELAGGGAKDAFPTNLCVDIVCVLESRGERNLNGIILLLR